MDDGSAAFIGQVLQDKWRIDAKIAVGGVAVVFHATHRDGHVAAVKVMHPQFARNPDVRRRFLREGYAANKVGHPGVVRILEDDSTEDGSPYIVMELLENGELLEDRRMRMGGRLPAFDVVKISLQILDVLTAAHDKGIVHRDIKPENIFILNDGTVKVLDFGIAHIREAAIAHEPTATGLLLGTPEFMSPEQALGKRGSIDAQTDVYALGATMFTLLTGEAVHSEDAVTMLLVAAATRQARSLASVRGQSYSPELVAVVDRALMLEKSRRYPTARAMQDALRTVSVRDEIPMTQATATLKAQPKMKGPPIKVPPLKAPPPQTERMAPKPLPAPPTLASNFAGSPTPAQHSSRSSRGPLPLPSRMSRIPQPPPTMHSPTEPQQKPLEVSPGPPPPLAIQARTKPAAPSLGLPPPRLRIDTPTAFAPPPIPSDLPPSIDDPEPTTLAPPAPRPGDDGPETALAPPMTSLPVSQSSGRLPAPPAPPAPNRPSQPTELFTGGSTITGVLPKIAGPPAMPAIPAGFADPDDREEESTLAGWAAETEDRPTGFLQRPAFEPPRAPVRSEGDDTLSAHGAPVAPPTAPGPSSPLNMPPLRFNTTGQKPPAPSSSRRELAAPPARGRLGDEEATLALTREQIEEAERRKQSSSSLAKRPVAKEDDSSEDLGALVAAMNTNRKPSGKIDRPSPVDAAGGTAPMPPIPMRPASVAEDDVPNVFGSLAPPTRPISPPPNPFGPEGGLDARDPFGAPPPPSPFFGAPMPEQPPTPGGPMMPMGGPSHGMHGAPYDPALAPTPIAPPVAYPTTAAAPQAMAATIPQGRPQGVPRGGAAPTFVIRPSPFRRAMDPLLKVYRGITKGIPQSTLVFAAVAATFLFLTLLLGSCLILRN